MAVDLILRGGLVVTEGGVVRADVAISGEKIVGIVASGETSQAKRVADIIADCGPSRRQKPTAASPRAFVARTVMIAGQFLPRLPNKLTGNRAPFRSEVPPRKTKHISLNVCSPKVTSRGGLKGLLGLFVLLS